ncbi:cytochrome b/b6 domain-containing protein [Bradyrhizobium sp. Tv2a-2]|uniref:cytochrome b n=1 Tax=Bradyrhizobium sp. Tv2a-2 TaxID=113395 RepID=UPI0004649399|nr:cytochrome b/b6 domain-containing protein [Bradyrhizobium sp. Tv2a-2]
MAEIPKLHQEGYDRLTIGLHWATAVMVAIQFVIGKTAPLLPRGALRVDIWSIHVVQGFVLSAVVLAGVFWRRMHRRTAPTERGVFRALATATHHMLEALLIMIVALGILDVFAHAFPLFNVVSFPRLGDDQFMRHVNAWHEVAANILIVVALGHAGAALLHHYVLRDNILTRMWPGPGERESGHNSTS